MIQSQSIKVRVAPKNDIQVRSLTLGRQISLSDISDVDISGVQDGYTLRYDSARHVFVAQQTIDSTAARINVSNTFAENQTFVKDVAVGGNLIITGDLIVNGTTTTVNTATLAIKDKNIELALGNNLDAAAHGGGITLHGTTDKTLSWSQATSSWFSSENVDLQSGRSYLVGGVPVISSTSLGSSIVNSSLTSVGTITSGTWRGSVLDMAFGGTGSALTPIAGGIVYSTPSGIAIAGSGFSGQVLVSGGTGVPVWTNSLSLNAPLIDNSSVVSCPTVTTTSNAAGQVLFAANGTTYRSVKFFIQGVDTVSGAFQSTEIMAIQNGSTVAHVEYATITIGGAVAQFDISYSNGILLTCAPTTSNSTVFRIFSIAIKV